MSVIDPEKQVQLDKVKELIRENGFTIVEENLTKPWGAGIMFAKKDIESFVSKYFSEKKQELLASGENLSPKYLLIAPNARLSWQYHHLRDELWRPIYGPGGVIISDTDEQTAPIFFEPGKIYQSKQGQRHRLLSGDGWTLLTEVWLHTNAANPSSEEDNVRLADDYSREGTNDPGELIRYN